MNKLLIAHICLLAIGTAGLLSIYAHPWMTLVVFSIWFVDTNLSYIAGFFAGEKACLETHESIH